MPFQGGLISVARRRAGDEDPRQVEQQRRVLVAARIEPGQRHQEFAAAQIGIADQVEGGIGRDEAVAVERAQQMRAAGADHVLDLGEVQAPARTACTGFGLGCAERRWYRAAPPPARRSRPSPARPRRAPRISACAQAVQPRLVAQFGKPGPAQQRPQRRIAERGPVEFGQMRVAAGCRRAAGDRRRRTATGRPCGPSARGRRRRRNS